MQERMVGGGIERWALVEQALMYHHALLQSLERVPLQQGAVLTLYKSKAHWDKELPGLLLEAQYVRDEIMHLRYNANVHTVHDATGMIRYTPDALMLILTHYREKSTLWRVLEQEVSADIITAGGAMMRAQPSRLPDFVDEALKKHYESRRKSWLYKVPDHIDETFARVQKSYKRPESGIVSLDAWRERSKREK